MSYSVPRACYGGFVGTRKIWTAEELEQLSPNERDAVVRSGFESDLTKVSPQLLERVRNKIDAHIAASEGTQPAER